MNHFVFQIKPEDIKAAVEELDGAAPFIFLGAFLLRPPPFTLLPLSIIAVSCSLVFGPVLGFVYIVTGTVLGAAASFYALRTFAGGGSLEDNGRENLLAVKEKMEENGFEAILMLRLLPVLNFDLLTYISAKTEVGFWKFLFATAIGTIPGSLMFGVFGSSLLSLKPVNLLFLGTLAVILSMLGWIMKKNIEQQIDTETLKEEVQAIRREARA